jgi:hypothetical protein
LVIIATAITLIFAKDNLATSTRQFEELVFLILNAAMVMLIILLMPVVQILSIQMKQIRLSLHHQHFLLPQMTILHHGEVRLLSIGLLKMLLRVAPLAIGAVRKFCLEANQLVLCGGTKLLSLPVLAHMVPLQKQYVLD